MNTVLEIVNLTKLYSGSPAVDGITFSVRDGELFGLIGPDGAGKTSLIRALCTLLKPTSGQIKIAGLDAQKDILAIRKILGYMPQRFSLYQDLTVEQNLQFFADLFKVLPDEREERLKQLYQFSRLEPFKKRLAGDLSGGMKQKLALSCALIHTPEILILDEPTYGVDPLSREEFWEILKLIKQEGTTILVSTAYMEEAELCDRVALMYRGKIITMGSPDQIKADYPYPLYRCEGINLQNLFHFFKGINEVKLIQLFGNAIHVSFSNEPSEEHWKTWQEQTAGQLRKWGSQMPSMEDLFMYFIDRENNRE
jgi:ABC-type multidrug transport system ATPase subunit